MRCRSPATQNAPQILPKFQVTVLCHGILKKMHRFEIFINYSYTGLGYYTGIRTYRTENFSPTQKQLTVCFVRSGIRIYRTRNLNPSQSGIRAIDCIVFIYLQQTYGSFGLLQSMAVCRVRLEKSQNVGLILCSTRLFLVSVWRP